MLLSSVSVAFWDEANDPDSPGPIDCNELWTGNVKVFGCDIGLLPGTSTRVCWEELVACHSVSLEVEGTGLCRCDAAGVELVKTDEVNPFSLLA